jgi:replication factor C large subunit
MFTEKYKPEKIEDIAGQKEAVLKIVKWFDEWKPGEKALLLYGPPGVGKTSVIEALAIERNLDFIEMNASNYRSAKQIRDNISSAVAQQSIFKRGKVFMIDEIDGLSGKSDRGGASEIIKMIESAKHPVVLTANNPYSKKLKSLRKHCKMVELPRLDVKSVENRLKDVIKKEKIVIERDALRELSKLAAGDLRAALKDLESLKYRKITVADVKTLSEREREISVYDALNKMFKANDVIEARRSIDNVDKNLDEIFWWIESNVTKEYDKPEEIAVAFDALSKADVFKKRIKETQNWRFLAYFVDFMTAGVTGARKKKYFKRVRYQYPTMIAVLGRTKFARMKQQKELEEYAKQFHCSVRKVRTEFLPYFKLF